MSAAFELRFQAEVLETIRQNPHSTETQIKNLVNWNPVDRVLLDRSLKKLVRTGLVTKMPGNFMRAAGPVYLATP